MLQEDSNSTVIIHVYGYGIRWRVYFHSLSIFQKILNLIFIDAIIIITQNT